MDVAAADPVAVVFGLARPGEPLAQAARDERFGNDRPGVEPRSALDADGREREAPRPDRQQQREGDLRSSVLKMDAFEQHVSRSQVQARRVRAGSGLRDRAAQVDAIEPRRQVQPAGDPQIPFGQRPRPAAQVQRDRERREIQRSRPSPHVVTVPHLEDAKRPLSPVDPRAAVKRRRHGGRGDAARDQAAAAQPPGEREGREDRGCQQQRGQAAAHERRPGAVDVEARGQQAQQPALAVGPIVQGAGRVRRQRDDREAEAAERRRRVTPHGHGGHQSQGQGGKRGDHEARRRARASPPHAERRTHGQRGAGQQRGSQRVARSPAEEREPTQDREHPERADGEQAELPIEQQRGQAGRDPRQRDVAGEAGTIGGGERRAAIERSEENEKPHDSPCADHPGDDARHARAASGERQAEAEDGQRQELGMQPRQRGRRERRQDQVAPRGLAPRRQQEDGGGQSRGRLWVDGDGVEGQRGSEREGRPAGEGQLVAAQRLAQEPMDEDAGQGSDGRKEEAHRAMATQRIGRSDQEGEAGRMDRVDRAPRTGW